MADPEYHDVSNLHPCTSGHGLPVAAFYAWRAPEFAYAVTCPRCGLGTMAPSVEEATAQWNDLHPDRDLTEAELALPPLDVDEVIPLPPRQYLCDDDVHIIQKLPMGGYACAQCGLGFREHHAIDIVCGTGGITAAE